MAILQRSSSLKAVHWKNLVEHGAMHYLLKDVFDGQQEKAWDGMMDLFGDLLSCTFSGFDEAATNSMKALKMKTIERLCWFERYFPLTELAPVVHTLLHVPDAVYRWGSVRNFWAFFNERFSILMTSFVS